MTLKRRKIDSTIEKRIVTGMIVSKKFLREVRPSINLSYFQNSFTKRVAEWSLAFYLQYEEASQGHIQDMYNREKERLKEEDSELIGKLLIEISQRYESSDGINVEYLLDQTLAYFKKRELEITASNIQHLLDQNKIDQAEDEVFSYNKVSRIVSTWVNPFDEENVNEVFEEEGSSFLEFPSEIGKFLGPFERRWLVGVSGTFKKGKTWFLQEFAILGMVSKRKVAFFSLEMPKKKMNERIYKRLIPGGPEEGIYEYPCFDCGRNQDGTCERNERVNRHALLIDNKRPPYHPDLPYRPCTYCKDHGMHSEYSIAFWFQPTKDPKGNILRTPAFKLGYVKERIAAMRVKYNKYIRLKVYPRFSANLSDISRDLDILEQIEEFVPDIIVVDYADILKPEREGLGGTDKEDETWMSLSKLAGERNALVVTATQLRRSALDKKQVSQSDSALWIGKLAHVDAMLSLNQNAEEKTAGAMRIGIMVHRFKEFSETANCYILQKLSFGQVNLESYIGNR